MAKALMLVCIFTACAKEPCPDPSVTAASPTKEITRPAVEPPLEFTCVARMRIRNWDGKYAAQVRNHSHCTTKPNEDICKFAGRSQMSMEKGQYQNVVNTPCFKTSHAYCFDFLSGSKETLADPQHMRRVLYEEVAKGYGSCFLSWYECNEEWHGRKEMDSPPFEKEQAEAQARLTKTPCEAF